MFPIIRLGALAIPTWGLLVSIAALSVLWVGRINSNARGLSPEFVEEAWPGLLLGGFIGAHLYYLAAVLGWPLREAPMRDIVDIFSGTAVQGGLLGGAAAA